MLDTLTPNFAIQFAPPTGYMARLLEHLQPYRHVPARLILRVAPDDSNASIAASGAYEGRFSLPRRSRLWAISGSSTDAAGFDMQLRSGDTFQPLFSRRIRYDNSTGQGGGTPASPLFFLPKPMLMMVDESDSAEQTKDAQIIVQLRNRAAAANAVQLVLWFMAPLEQQQ